MIIIILIFLFFFSTNVNSKNIFYINEIEIIGLKNVSKEQVLDIIKKNNKTEIKDLFSKFVEMKSFKKIKIFTRYRKLTILFNERPYIKNVKLNCENPNIVKKVINKQKIIKGNMYEYGKLRLLRNKIRDKYAAKGFHNIKINIKVKKNYNNSVNINVEVIKNNQFSVKKIKFLGNESISKKRILSTFRTSDSIWMLLFGKTNIYIKSKINFDIKRLRELYLNQGFADFQINYIKIKLNKKENKISIFVNIFEGDKHRFKQINIINKRENIIRERIQKIVDFHVKKGDFFSQKNLEAARKEINNFFHISGFLNAKAEYKILNTDNNYVDVDFTYAIFNKVTIKRIHFKKNKNTNDLVLRKLTRQMESCIVSIDKLYETKTEIIRAGYAKKVTFDFVKNKDKSAVEVIIKLKEKNNNKLFAGCHYNKKNGLTLQAIAESINFIGTGKDLNLNITKNNRLIDYNLTITHPRFVTKLNMDLQNSIYYKIEIPKKNTQFTINVCGFSNLLSFKLHKNAKFHFIIGNEATTIKVPGFKNIPQLRRFVNRYGLKFKEYYITIMYVYSTITKGFYPNEGIFSKISLRLTSPLSKIKYYIFCYDLNYYKELTNDFILNLLLNFDYGDKYDGSINYPFFKNFTLLGKNNIRGYTQKTIGPKKYSKDLTNGGNLLVTLKISIFFPIPVLTETKKIKTALFFDIGQTYETNKKLKTRPFDVPKGSTYNSFLRFSYGISIGFLTPLNIPVEINIAKPLKITEWDKKETFSISIGTGAKR